MFGYSYHAAGNAVIIIHLGPLSLRPSQKHFFSLSLFAASREKLRLLIDECLVVFVVQKIFYQDFFSLLKKNF